MTTTPRRATGRPRGFDADEALDRALLVFWEQGFEGASLANLTEAMGISTASMYATFGNKEQLFRKALERYDEGPSAYVPLALAEPTALGVATALLAGTIRTTTHPDQPQGCLGVQGALATGDAGREVRALLVDWRKNGFARVRERFERAVAEGDLPADTDPALLARYVTVLQQGIAVEAAGGVDAGELQELADAALRNWPLP
ncbi:DNA-binding transcriptional regulator, AcrR family [Lentzea waywayandensis]|uniref:DNA-binding transcriptional regulator, AcrR family n=1 Tax=Lentzea waywayandensis TaxID=84724 RepID=A0A1I6FD55_9PSEU|nr:TetR/AcrR family transcriptional regulator [Lentzea waywayandensis]SFR27911.1 DNA-binding transcriptional regulator, AcrR family [Lentzea waywayandensis]